MNERAARDVVIVRAIETADGAREIWSDADRLWAGRAAAESVGESAPGDAYLARRAGFALQRLATRHPRFVALSSVHSARRWLAPVVALVAFAIGAAGADIGPLRRINLLAPPVLALLAWNVAVYVILLSSVVVSRGRPDGDFGGPFRKAVVAWLADAARPVRKALLPRPLVAALARFSGEWAALASRLWKLRAAWLLHLCAAALATGAIAGLYLRGVALEYRAAWQSTFLDATDVARLLQIVVAPGAWLTGIAIPGAEHLQRIGAGSAGENAAPWIHLYAATLVLVVLVPRITLAAIAWLREQRLARHFPIALEQPYFRRLLHAWRQGTARIVVLPYSFDVPKPSAHGLARLLTRAFESAVEIEWASPVAYGADEVPDLASQPATAVVAVFNLTATPERENQGAFAHALDAAVGGRAQVIAVVDTSDFVKRFRDNPQRVAERRAAWQHALAAQGIEPVFVRLADPDLAEAAAALTRHFEHVTS